MAGVLDSDAPARLRRHGALNVCAYDVQGHGAGRPRRFHGAAAAYTTVGGIPSRSPAEGQRVDALSQRTRDGGAEIVNSEKTGSAYYAPAMSAVEMVQAILRDEKARHHVQRPPGPGEYGPEGHLPRGCRSSLGAGGVERVHRAGARSGREGGPACLRRGVREMIEELALDAVSGSRGAQRGAPGPCPGGRVSKRTRSPPVRALGVIPARIGATRFSGQAAWPCSWASRSSCTWRSAPPPARGWRASWWRPTTTRSCPP